MPAPTQFSLIDFCQNPSYPALVEVRLTTLPNPHTAFATPSLLTEPTFSGYRRFRSDQDDIFALKNVFGGMATGLSNRLHWVGYAGLPQSVTGAVVTVTFPGEAAQCLEIFEFAKTLAAAAPGMSFSFALSTSAIVS